MSGCVVGVVSALKSEASCLVNSDVSLLKTVEVEPGTRFCLGGMGVAGALSASQMLHRDGVDALISFGVAAALDRKLTPGDLIIPEVIYYKGKKLPVALDWRERVVELLVPGLAVSSGTLAHAQSPLFSQQEKLALCNETGACAADMESAVVAEFAAQMDIPFIAIRAIVDPLAFSPPPALLGAVHTDGTANIMKLLPLLLKGSVPIKTLLHLGMGMRSACSALNKVVKTAGLGFQYDLANSRHVRT